MQKSKIALFIDAENLTGWIKNSGPESLLADLSSSGQVITRRAYGVWSQPNMTPLQSSLNQMGFELLHSYHPVSGKNSTDILMTVDIMEHALRLKDVEWFVLATGDSDFSPLFRKLREMGKEVIGVGPKSPLSESVKTSCSRYIYTDTSSTSVILDYDDAADLVEKLINSESDPVPLGLLKSSLVNSNSAFNEKLLGYSSFRLFIDSIDTVSAYCSSDNTTWYAKPFKKETAIENLQSTDEMPSATVEKYTSILRQFNWRLVSKDTIYQINARLKNSVTMERSELVEYILNALSSDRPHITATEIRKALAIFSKSGLLKLTEEKHSKHPNKLKYQHIAGFTKLIDNAMISRLIQGCQDNTIAFNLKVTQELLYGEYDVNKLNKTCSTLKREIGLQQ